jgi:hypothetical protein
MNMDYQTPESRGTDPMPAVYVITDDGLKLQEAPCGAAAPVEKKRSGGSPLLWTSLVLALLAYYLDAGKWAKSVEASINRRQQSMACAPYRNWVAQHPLGYAEVAADPMAWTGKPVLWGISRGPDGGFYCGQEAANRIFWTDPAAGELAGLPQGGGPLKVLALIESSESPTPVLAFLETEK